MSTPASPRQERVLGAPAGRQALAAVQDWTPPSYEELADMPPPPAYPAEGWRTAQALLRQETGADAQAVAAAETAAREKLARVQAEHRARAAEGSAVTAAPSLQASAPQVVALTEDMPLAQMVAARPAEAAQVVRTLLAGSERAPGEAASQQGRVGTFFVALGDALASQVLGHLSAYEVEEVAHAVSALQEVSRDAAAAVQEDFRRQLLAGAGYRGGIEFARAALGRCFGPRRAQEVLERVATRVSSGFYMLKNVAPDQFAPFLSHEHPQTIALILSQLERAQASGILAQLPERMQADVAYRIATMENVTPAVIRQIEESLESSLRDILGGNQDVGGPKVVADILNLTGSSVEKNVLDQMDAQDPEVAEAVRNLMFVFEDISRLTDREIQILLREVDQKDLVVALKAASADLKTKVLGNVSETVRTTIQEEMEFLGPMRLSEVEEVQLRIVQQVRQLEEQGQITIVRGGVELFV
ncbi:MAG: flagellar motor switch protein FliG [Candidatus Latescibacterota bacterium]